MSSLVKDREIEGSRLAALKRLNILDTPPEPVFDRLCQIAAESLDLPISLISLIDSDRQWFKARHGIDVSETPRDVAFCSHAIKSDSPLIVDDASKDPCFADNPLVTGEPAIRFYAGFPLAVEEGHRVGTLCVIGPEPRHLAPHEQALLAELASLAASELQRRDLEQRLKRELQRARRQMQRMRSYNIRSTLVSRLANVGWWEYHIDTSEMHWSAEVFRIYGVGADTLPSLQVTIDRYDPAVRDEITATVKAASATGKEFAFEHPIILPGGERRWARVMGRPTLSGKTVTCISGAVQDVTDRRVAEERAHHLAYHDALTGLANRSQFNDRLDTAIAGRSDGRFTALLLIDLDHLKDVNDTLGHEAGDAAITEIAVRLRGCVRSTDTIARLGGDEFAIVMANVSAVAVGRVIEAIYRSLEAPWRYRREVRTLSLSIGAALHPIEDQHATDLYRNADLALYQAKASGRGRYSFYNQTMRTNFEGLRDIVGRVHTGVERGEFVLFYQPIIDLRTGSVNGFEALLRWQHPTLGLLLPASFGAAFDDPIVGPVLGDAVLSLAIDQMGKWDASGIDYRRIAVNLSGEQFRASDAARRIITTLENNAVAASRLQVEVTENVVLSRDGERVSATLKTLHTAGVGVALDDFGTGFASLVHLTRYPIDALKIDQSFVRALPDDEASALIVRAIISLAHGLGKYVVAEGIETTEQARFLRQLGCDFGQGFLFAPALTAEDVETLLQTSSIGFRRALKTLTINKAA